MYSILIAEDSKPILRNIQSLLESLGLPITVAATAANGEEALAMVRENPVDILLADIRMPKLSGLELIEQAKPLVPRLKVVLISGYSDFEYTRKALSLQVFDYLLKPVKPAQLKDVMERLIADLDERRSTDTERFKEMLDPEFRKGLKLEQDFDSRRHHAFVVAKTPFTPGAGKWTASEVEAALNEAFAPNRVAAWPIRHERTFLALVEHPGDGSSLPLSEMMPALQRRLLARGLHASIAGGMHPLEADQLPAFCLEAASLLAERLAVGQSVFLHANGSMPPERNGTGAAERIVEEFVQMLRQRQKDRFLLALSERLNRFENESARMEELRQFVSRLRDAVGRMLAEHNPADRFKFEESVSSLLESPTYAGFSEALLATMGIAFDKLLSHNRTSSYELFRQIEAYIKLNLYAQISITDLGEKLHVSPSYVSRIVKRYSNRTFVHYYMDLKIKEACRLLSEKPDMKIKDLSDTLAFSDQHYFSKVFKEYAGCSPTDFKTANYRASALPGIQK